MTTVTDLTPVLATEGCLRDRWAAQLEAMAALLENTPGLPVHRNGQARIQYDARSVVEVDEIARLLGKEASWNTGRTHYRAVHAAGPNVHYVAVYITPEHMAEHDALNSYRGAVRAAVAA
jgi:hypothetical protein